MLRVMLLLSLLLAAFGARKPTKADYCKMCKPKGSHTMCRFPAGPGDNCTGYMQAPLSLKEKRTILNLHNQLRSRVARGQGLSPQSNRFGAQPKAADMCELAWDSELETLAQRWADQCLPFYTTTPHDTCRDTVRFTVGQNIVTSAYSQPVSSDVAARTMDWYNEIVDYNPRWVDKFVLNPEPQKQIGHYTQLVWGATCYLGCVRVVFEERIDNATWTVERIVCDYGPSGNYLNFPVYKVGEPCSACPRGTKCSKRYKGLCKAIEVAADEEDLNSDESDSTESWLHTTNDIVSDTTTEELPFTDKLKFFY